MTTTAEIAIIGVGIYPFGRDPDRSALAQLYGAPGSAPAAILSR